MEKQLVKAAAFLAVLALVIGSATAGAGEGSRERGEIEEAASDLSAALRSVELALETPTDVRSAELQPHVRVEVGAAVAELEQLAAMVRSGWSREETRPLSQRLAARRQGVLRALQGMDRGGPSREQVAAAQAIWKKLADYYR